MPYCLRTARLSGLFSFGVVVPRRQYAPIMLKRLASGITFVTQLSRIVKNNNTVNYSWQHPLPLNRDYAYDHHFIYLAYCQEVYEYFVSFFVLCDADVTICSFFWSFFRAMRTSAALQAAPRPSFIILARLIRRKPDYGCDNRAYNIRTHPSTLIITRQHDSF